MTPILDARPTLDPLNRKATLDPTQPRPYRWRALDHFLQGNRGACVPHSGGHWCRSRPHLLPVTHADVWRWYDRCRVEFDEWPNADYEGTSVNALCKCFRDEGIIEDWAFLDDPTAFAVWVSRKDTGIITVPWFRGMFNHDPEGFVEPTGPLEGWHAISINGFSPRRDAYWCWNSWEDWGVEGGGFWLRREHVTAWMPLGVDLCVVTSR